MNAGLPEIPEPFVQAVRNLLLKHPQGASPYRLPLSVNTFGELEIAAALEALVRGPMTMGPRVREFETRFAASLGRAHAVFCNSGSSANLLAFTALTRGAGPHGRPLLERGDEVIVPAVTWATTVWPIAQVGAVPVLADVSPDTLNLTVESVERAFSPRTRAVFVAHTLGNPAPLDELSALCARRGVVLLEDVCEALDAEISGCKAGTAGRLATFSFYFSHHISTIEGGMIVCSKDEDADHLRVLRAHGWTRQMSEGRRREAERAHPHIDPRFLFVDVGYNLRGTDVQAAIGLVQLARRGPFVERRRQVAAAWSLAVQRHDRLFAPVRFAPGASPFAFPIVVRPSARVERRRVVEFLETEGIETRPLVAGNLARQPALALVPHRVSGPLPGADLLHERAIYVGIHPLLTDHQIATLPEALDVLAREVQP